MNEGQTQGARLARNSDEEKPYVCAFEWPHNCYVQCGGSGIVLERGAPSLEEVFCDVAKAENVIARQVPHRITAFFEAFPQSPGTFLRGEGTTVQEAEEKCWKRYQRILACAHHEYERRDRVDGYCFCKHCGLSGMFLPPLHPCAGCQATQYKVWSVDKNEATYCQNCFEKLPEEMLSDISIKLNRMVKTHSRMVKTHSRMVKTRSRSPASS
jgi:hypothetical protein